MRKWLEYSLSKKKKNFKNQFSYSNHLLKRDDKNLKKLNNFNEFKKNKLFFTQYKYFKNKIKNNTIFLCSGYGLYEYFLKKNFKNFIISDVSAKYKKYNSYNKFLDFKKVNVLKPLDFKKFKFKPSVIVLNNVEYLFNDYQMLNCMGNISLLANKKTKIYIIFRSRYYSFLSFYDKILLPAELILKKIIFFIMGKKRVLNLNLHGYRRTKYEFEYLLKKKFKVLNLYEDLYTLDYERSLLIRKLKLEKFLKFIFLNSHPYLNIYKLKKKTSN